MRSFSPSTGVTSAKALYVHYRYSMVMYRKGDSAVSRSASRGSQHKSLAFVNLCRRVEGQFEVVQHVTANHPLHG